MADKLTLSEKAKALAVLSQEIEELEILERNLHRQLANIQTKIGGLRAVAQSILQLNCPEA